MIEYTTENNHAFNKYIANDFDIVTALIFNEFVFMVSRKNKSKEGRRSNTNQWVTFTMDKIIQKFSYLGQECIQNTIMNLLSDGIIDLKVLSKNPPSCFAVTITEYGEELYNDYTYGD